MKSPIKNNKNTNSCTNTRATIKTKIKTKIKKSVKVTSAFHILSMSIAIKLKQLGILLLLVIALPVTLFNAFSALLNQSTLFYTKYKTDCLGRQYPILKFTSGVFKSSALLFSLLSCRISMIGLPSLSIYDARNEEKALELYTQKFGLFHSLYAAHASGLVQTNPCQKLQNQGSLSAIKNVGLILSCLFTTVFYCRESKPLNEPNKFSVFGISINNDSLIEAAQWATDSHNDSEDGRCQVGCFVNVNSINLTFKHSVLAQALNQSDRCFADGSGMRVAAKHAGVRIKENVNGTDLLPQLCRKAIQKGQSLYLLGGEHGVAGSAVKKLKADFPGLKIAGYQHGFFDNSAQVVHDINNSGANILLVAIGSPRQEDWLIEHAHKLNCDVGLAVGGLFDFVSGKFSRAPLWLRENGLEWVWRLMSDPKTKFNRYVIGNPRFLIRTFLHPSF